MKLRVDLRSLRGHELAFLIHIMTDASTSLFHAFPPLGFELLKVLENELYGRAAEKRLGEWELSMTFDYEADKVLLQAQDAGRWCDAVLERVSREEGFENVAGLLESLRSQLAAAIVEMQDRRQILDALADGQS